MLYASTGALAELLSELSAEYQVVVPARRGDRLAYVPLAEAPHGFVVGDARCFEPLKAFFLQARRRVAEDFAPEPPLSEDKPLCIVGAKACDLKAFAIQDHVFLGDVPDPFYEHQRGRNLIIAADCTRPLDTCFCTALGMEPHPADGFDLCLSPAADGFLVAGGSERGRRLLQRHGALLSAPPPGAEEERDARRAAVREAVDTRVDAAGVPRADALEGAVRRGFDSGVWDRHAATCVECGACNTVCPTCHCFFLMDQQDGSATARLRLWDSCLLKDFARVAGGGNPRPELWMRLRNRFEKKFDYFPHVAGEYACTGCGRCIAACPGTIDIRTVLKELVRDGQQRESVPVH